MNKIQVYKRKVLSGKDTEFPISLNEYCKNIEIVPTKLSIHPIASDYNRMKKMCRDVLRGNYCVYAREYPYCVS